MQTELHSLSKLFTEALYRIPDYQRGYAWRERQIKDFWSDLEQLQQGANHYTGVLTLEEVPPEEYARWEDDRWIIEAKHFSPYYVVDGQQRLTTIVILLQCLVVAIGVERQVNYTSVDEIRKKFIFESRDGGISRSFLFGYEKDNPSYEFLKTVILEERSDSYSPSEETIYTHNLMAAKEFFKQKLMPLSLPELAQLYTKVTQHLLFNVYVIAREIDVFVAFETMNNRGKPLSHLELLKNRLIFLSTKFNVDPEEKGRLRRIINESWKTVYHYLGKNKNRPLDDDLFLSMHHWLQFQPPEEEGLPRRRRYWRPYYDDDRDSLLDSVFTVRNLPVHGKEKPKQELSVGVLYEYSHNIKDAVKLYYEILNPHDSRFSDAEKIWLEKLRRIADPDEIMLIFAAYQTPATDEARTKFLKLSEKLLFLSAMIPYVPRMEPVNFSRLAIQLATNKKTLADIVVMLTQYLERILKDADIGGVLREWAKRSRGKGLRYFMFEYEQELKSLSKTERDKLTWEEFALERYEQDYATIEHIYPQRAVEECWKKAFASYSVKQRNMLRNAIGNLVPLSKPKNSSLSNKCFKDKKGSDASTVGYVYGCYSENEVAQSEDWTAKEIFERSLRLLEFLERRWEMPIGDRQRKIDVLGLDFVLSGQQLLTDLAEPTIEYADDDEEAV